MNKIALTYRFDMLLKKLGAGCVAITRLRLFFVFRFHFTLRSVENLLKSME